MIFRVKTLAFVLFFASLLLSVGCDRAIPCVSADNCPADSACIEGACQLRDCFSNADCPIEKWCDTDVGQCQTGCKTEEDCRFGDTCDAGTCVEQGCQSTQNDCFAGEYCDVSTGECFPAAAPHCESCETADECGGGNNICSRVSGEGPFCLIACDNTHPCPAGYGCIGLTHNGEIYSYNCVTLCHIVNGESDGSEKLMSVDVQAATVEFP